MSTKRANIKVLMIGEEFAGGYLSDLSREAFFMWIAQKKRLGGEWNVELYCILHGNHRPMKEMKAMALKALQTRRIRLTRTEVKPDGLYACGLVTVTYQQYKQTFVWTAARESPKEAWVPRRIGIDFRDWEPDELLAPPPVLEETIIRYLCQKARKKS